MAGSQFLCSDIYCTLHIPEDLIVALNGYHEFVTVPTGFLVRQSRSQRHGSHRERETTPTRRDLRAKEGNRRLLTLLHNYLAPPAVSTARRDCVEVNVGRGSRSRYHRTINFKNQASPQTYLPAATCSEQRSTEYPPYFGPLRLIHGFGSFGQVRRSTS